MNWSVAITLGGLLIDAGGALNERRLVKEGVDLLEDALASVPDEYLADAHYNLGTGYLALGQRERGVGPGTRASLTNAVSHLNESLQLRPTPNTRTNLAAALMAQGRWIEAYDELEMVLTEVPSHHVALARQAGALIEIYKWSQRHTGLLTAALLNYRKAAELSKDVPLYKGHYQEQIRSLEKRLGKAELKKLENFTPTPATEVENWIWEQRLSLNMCPLCKIDTPDAFDTAIVGAVLAGGVRRPTITEVYDLVNSLHRSFGAARWCLLQGVGVVEISYPEQIVIIPGSPSACHDLKTGLIVNALSGFYSILSQIAFALNSYLHLGHPDEYVTFQRVWFPKGNRRGIPKTRSELHPRIRRFSAPSLAALYRLAISLEHGLGIYDELRKLRNSLEHHVVVASTDSSGSRYFKTIEPDLLVENAVKMGRIAKAAMLYFGATIWRAEYDRLKRSERAGVVVAPGVGPSVRRL
jgi:tetratricopeptide (TPR) repeat protein